MDDWSNLIEWSGVMVRCRAEMIAKIWRTEAEKGAYRSGMKRKKYHLESTPRTSFSTTRNH